MQLINPAPRATIINALLHPDEVTKAHQELFGSDDVDTTDANSGETPSLIMPDTSILLKRYMEAGRLVNVYDLFESFSVALDQQQEQLSQAGRRRKEKEKGEAVEADEDSSEKDEEQWAVEVHARFMRALHELDYMGFIKHTGRKADHVLRTVYDVPD